MGISRTRLGLLVVVALGALGAVIGLTIAVSHKTGSKTIGTPPPVSADIAACIDFYATVPFPEEPVVTLAELCEVVVAVRGGELATALGSPSDFNIGVYPQYDRRAEISTPESWADEVAEWAKQFGDVVVVTTFPDCVELAKCS